jgi:thiosulfate/3-mercaptopyruvate sulfurtransferase
VGVCLAAELQTAGVEAVLVGRGRQLELLRAGRVRYLRPDGERRLEIECAGGPGEVQLTDDDVLVLAVKTQQADEVCAEWAWQPVAGAATGAAAGEVLPLLTVQNGLDAERSALRRFRTVLGSVVWIPATYTDDGEVFTPAAPAPGVIWLGRHPDGSAPAPSAPMAADLEAAGFVVQVVEDLSRWKAAKLVVSSTFVLDALYPDGPERSRAAGAVQRESRQILEQAGYGVADVAAESTVDLNRFVLTPVPGRERGGSSTWQSLVRGTSLETDFLNGEISLLARLSGRRAPLNEALMARVHAARRDGAAAGSLPVEDLLEVTARAQVVVDAADLRHEMDSAQPPALLDVRWVLGDSEGRRRHLEGHLPGAVYVDMDTELAAPPTPGAGRHPLPDVGELQTAARRWGLRTGQPVVVYDDNRSQSAGRAWWLLRWAGLTDVRILDGGLQAWVASGGPLESGPVEPVPGDVELSGNHLPTIDADEAASFGLRGVLVDARAAERYEGSTEPIDPRAGHIPGSVNLPTAANVDDHGRFGTVAALRSRFAGIAGSPEVAVYCGSGVTAAHEIAAMQIAGIDAALYPGSWSAWSSDPERPAATGPGPG